MGNLGNPRSPVANSQNMEPAVNLADTAARYFQKTWTTLKLPEPIKIVIIKKCPKLLRIYSNEVLSWSSKKLPRFSKRKGYWKCELNHSLYAQITKYVYHNILIIFTAIFAYQVLRNLNCKISNMWRQNEK